LDDDCFFFSPAPGVTDEIYGVLRPRSPPFLEDGPADRLAIGPVPAPVTVFSSRLPYLQLGPQIGPLNTWGRTANNFLSPPRSRFPFPLPMKSPALAGPRAISPPPWLRKFPRHWSPPPPRSRGPLPRLVARILRHETTREWRGCTEGRGIRAPFSPESNLRAPLRISPASRPPLLWKRSPCVNLKYKLFREPAPDPPRASLAPPGLFSRARPTVFFVEI